MFETRYRVVRDQYSGFEAQCRVWWWPFWTQMGWGGNTHSTLEKAQNYCMENGRVLSHYDPKVGEWRAGK